MKPERKERLKYLIMTARSIENKFFNNEHANWKLKRKRNTHRYSGTCHIVKDEKGNFDKDRSWISIAPSIIPDGHVDFLSLDLIIIHELCHWQCCHPITMTDKSMEGILRKRLKKLSINLKNKTIGTGTNWPNALKKILRN